MFPDEVKMKEKEVNADQQTERISLLHNCRGSTFTMRMHKYIQKLHIRTLYVCT